ncbi:NAD(P)-binding domain-containing protein [Sphingobacterium sp. LRF_L2]|uniref:NAD(P)-binding domain-containing protein n=1 Tax=Sphingobacterium sp. LRF_L2 TaxID=3369421 RepID=UPI003F5D6A6C
MNPHKIYDLIIIGAGQAGLASSYYAKHAALSHIILEKHEIGSSWSRQRWDSFKMNTPNWMTTLPGLPLLDGENMFFMSTNEFLDYLENYVKKFDLPVRTGVKVLSVEKENNYFVVETRNGSTETKLYSRTVVLASGCMNKIQYPKIAEIFPNTLYQVHAGEYKNPNQLPKGAVLVVGAGQSGCQIAEELALSGRKVYLCSSKVPRAPRRYKGRDIMDWMNRMGAMDCSVDQQKESSTRQMTQPQTSGQGELGHTVSYQSLHIIGVEILGSLKDIKENIVFFEDNNKENIAFADQSSKALKKGIDTYLLRQGHTESDEEFIDKADLSDDSFSAASNRKAIDMVSSSIKSVVWATGFGADFSYLPTALLNEKGVPLQEKGKLALEGIYCLGLPWLTKKKSGLVFGVQEDAQRIIEFVVSFIRNK